MYSVKCMYIYIVNIQVHVNVFEMILYVRTSKKGSQSSFIDKVKP